MYGNSNNGSPLYKKNSDRDLSQVVTNSCRFMMEYGLCFNIRCFFLIFQYECRLYSVAEIGCTFGLVLLYPIVLNKDKQNFGLESFQLLETLVMVYCLMFLSMIFLFPVLKLWKHFEFLSLPCTLLTSDHWPDSISSSLILNFILFFPQSSLQFTDCQHYF